jgi:hypothetical protein
MLRRLCNFNQIRFKASFSKSIDFKSEEKYRKNKLEEKKNHLNSYGPNDTIVLFSGKRMNFPGMGKHFWENGNAYADILEEASKSYGNYVFRQNDFRALSVINLAMNLCSYRQFYEENPTQFNNVKSVIGFGLG